MNPPAAPDWSTRSIAFLGPVGTFSEQALLSQPDLGTAHLLPMQNFASVIRAAEDGEVDAAFVAIENSIEGTVNVTQDALAFDSNLLIQREVVIPIHLVLMAQPGVTLDQLTTVWSFPHALAQCRHYMAANLPDAVTEASNSTADAARLLAASGDRFGAAIAPARAAEVYGLQVLAEAIEDHDDNSTRFLLIAPDTVPAPTGDDKTSIVVYERSDEPGSLLTILQEFSSRGINLTKIESRPTRRGLGDYCFLIDLAGHIADDNVADALRTLKAEQAEVKFLGSYASAVSAPAPTRHEVVDAERRADDWIDDLRHRIG